MKKGCVVIQTCDFYKNYWDGFFWSFNKYWDKKINWPVYFCNEEISLEFKESNFIQLKTGIGNHSNNLSKILDNLIDYEYIFYMLEDFWMTDQMTEDMFSKLFDLTKKNEWDSLRVSTYLPEYYKLESTNHFVNNQRVLKYSKDSKWQFSQQAGFWKRKFLRDCVVESNISEREISSSLPGEIATDNYLREHYPNAEIYHYHYHWYPVSGVAWRGKITQIGEQIEFLRKVDLVFNQRFQ
jgi:hypothetical protein